MSADGFARVPLWILGRSDVSWPAKVLYGLLARFVGKGRSAWPSVEAIAGDMRTSRRNVERWLAELRSAGLIDVERTGRASTYTLLGSPPEPVPSEAPRSAADGASDPPPMADQMRQERRNGSARVGVSDAPRLADQMRQGWRNSGADTVLREKIIEEITEERAPAAGPVRDAEELLEEAHRALIRGYQRRYEAAVQDAWMGADRSHRDVRACARWAATRGAEHVEARVEQLLTGVFADERLREERWPWAWIAKDPARYAAGPSSPRGPRKTAFLDAGQDFSGFDDAPIGAGGAG